MHSADIHQDESGEPEEVDRTLEVEDRRQSRRCLYCGNTFKPRRFWQRYCKDEHRRATHREETANAIAAYRNKRQKEI